MIDGTDAVRKALSAILRTGESFGAGHLIDILTGARTEKIAQRGHDRLPTFGVGREFTKAQWQGLFRQMMGHDLVRPDRDRHGALVMTEAARPVLKGDARVRLRRDAVTAVARSGPVARALVSDDDAPLLSALKAKRRALAEAANVPAYVIFPDRTLIEMAETRPSTLDAMARVGGVGATKLDRYGATFLAVIAGAAPPPAHPRRRALAGREEGAAFDRLQAAQAGLMRGDSGLDRPLSCTGAELARIARAAPHDMAGIAAIIGDQRAARFGSAFLAALADEG